LYTSALKELKSLKLMIEEQLIWKTKNKH
jgi:hypothetical protein